MSAKPRASGGRLPDVSSSVFSASGVLLVLAVALLLKWAYGFDRRRRPDVVAQVLARDVLEERPDPAFPRDPVLLRQRNDMISTPSPAPEGAVLTPEADEAEQPRRDGVTVLPRPARVRAPMLVLGALEDAMHELVGTDLTLRSSSRAPAMAVMERALIRLAMMPRGTR